MKRFIFLLLVNFFAFTVTANNQNSEDYSYNYGAVCNQIYDPYEKMNRKIFAFNSVLDRFLLRPVAIGYKNVTNDYSKARVSSFLENINMPVTIINYGLQVDYGQTMKSIWRFLINSTVGIGGIFDVASKIGLKVTVQTLGSTFARYGVAPGPYLVLPFIGSTNLRDMTDTALTNNYFNPIMYMVHRDFAWTVTGVEIIDIRMALLPFTDYVEHNSTDPYIAVRSAIHQNRESKVVYPKNFKCQASN